MYFTHPFDVLVMPASDFRIFVTEKCPCVQYILPCIQFYAGIPEGRARRPENCFRNISPQCVVRRCIEHTGMLSLKFYVRIPGGQLSAWIWSGIWKSPSLHFAFTIPLKSILEQEFQMLGTSISHSLISLNSWSVHASTFLVEFELWKGYTLK